eukprot:gene1947-2630_t
MAKLQGTVNWFNGTKGFGFITRDDNQGDVFVHQSDLHAEGFRSLQEGEQVEFTVETGEDGRAKAVDVTEEELTGLAAVLYPELGTEKETNTPDEHAGERGKINALDADSGPLDSADVDEWGKVLREQGKLGESR